MTNSFPTLLSRFNELVKESPSVKSIQADLDKIKEEAKNNSSLTGRQASAVIDRVNNYVVGKYGKNR